jgi:hypothetical protein
MANELASQSGNNFTVRRSDILFDKEGRTVIDDKEAATFLKGYLEEEGNRFVSIGDLRIADTNYVLCGGNGYCPKSAAAKIDDIATTPR